MKLAPGLHNEVSHAQGWAAACPTCNQQARDVRFCTVCGDRRKALEPGFTTCKGCTTDADRAEARKTPGQLAYEEDVRQEPNYHDGQPRPTWAELGRMSAGPAMQDTWERNPTPKPRAVQFAPSALADELTNILRCYDRDNIPNRQTNRASGPAVDVSISCAAAERIRQLLSSL